MSHKLVIWSYFSNSRTCVPGAGAAYGRKRASERSSQMADTQTTPPRQPQPAPDRTSPQPVYRDWAAI